ncbi:MAG: quinolinate synthase NadA [Phycisphaerales bacterium]|nr:quinolinate synthase NadA [Phycisphaerales bacterium]
MLTQVPLPEKYHTLSLEQMAERIGAHKRAFGDRLVILGHHYQRDDVIRFADFTGDSLKLSQLAARQKNAEFVVFCGVHFMAESADILTDDSVQVILPDLTAGCSMADMATLEQVEEAWAYLTDVTDEKIIPITYVNSAASIKAFCGRHDGACCTSSNARRILEYALDQGDKVLFLPDQHLGRNTAYAMGWPLESMILYGPDDNDFSDEQIRQAKFILWKGFCSVHQYFTPEDCAQVRRTDPDRKIIVHPECCWEVVQKADLAGSTEYIIKVITEAPDGSRWAVGTEINLVHRLIEQNLGRKDIRLLGKPQCLCTTMFRIDLPHLLWCLDELAAGRVVNRITVDPATRRDALLALERMLEHVHAEPVSSK